MSFEQQQLVLLHQWSWSWTSQSHASEEAHQSNHAPHAFVHALQTLLADVHCPKRLSEALKLCQIGMAMNCRPQPTLMYPVCHVKPMDVGLRFKGCVLQQEGLCY